MEKDVRKYISTCVSCQHNKDSTLAPARLLQPLPIPDRPWESILMDFITHLQQTPRGHDSVTVFVDRLTKMVHLCPGRSTDTAEDVACQFLDTIFKHHGLPKHIVSDCDSLFTGLYWCSMMKGLNIKLGMSSAFHPQTDGQTEHAN